MKTETRTMPSLRLSHRTILRQRRAASLGTGFLLAVTSLSMLAVFFIFFFIARDALPFFRLQGMREFFTSTHWYPSAGEAEFGALAMFVGSALVTLGATLVAVPLGIAAAVCLSDVIPFSLRQVIKPIIEMLWSKGIQVMFYAEGKWGHHLDRFAELPDGSIIYHCDQDDIFEVHRRIGGKFALSGGIPNALLSYGTPQQVRDCCKKVIDGVARDGGYIMDASAIVQNDAKVENMKAMTDFTREYGVY